MDPIAAPRRPSERFIGRTEELSALRTHLAAAEAGRGRIVLIAGDAGIGKTRIVEEVLEPLPQSRVLWGRCRDDEGMPAYWPWRQVLSAYVERTAAERVRADLGADAGDLARLIPALRARFGIAPRAIAGAEEAARFRLFEAVAEMVSRASSDGLLVVVLDDLHWADSESLLLLRHLGAAIRSTRVLVLGTYREIEMRQTAAVPRILGDLARVSKRIMMRGLTREDVGAFAAGNVAGITRDAVVDLHRITEGNPFFVKQVMALLLRDGWRPGGRLPVPTEVHEAVRLRLEPLAAPVRELLARAAVLGREFELGTLTQLARLGEAETLALLGEPIALGLVGEVDEASIRLRFGHALVQHTLYHDLPSAERASLHRDAGSILERMLPFRGDTIVGEVAHHLLRALDRESLEKAIELSERAAQQALAVLGWEDAAAHYERALAALQQIGGPQPQRLRLLIGFGQAQALAGDIDGYRATFEEAGRLARALGDAERLAEAAVAFGTAPALQAVDPIRLELLEAALAALPEADSISRAHVLAHLSLASYYTAPFERRTALARAAVAIARRLGDVSTEAVGLRSHYYNLIGTRDVHTRLGVLHDIARAASASGDHGLACDARVNAAVDYLAIGDLAHADRALEIAAETAERQRMPHWRWRATVQRAVRALLAGHLAEAEMLSEHAAAMGGSGARQADAASIHAGILFHIRRAQGRLGELMPVLAAFAEQDSGPVWRSVQAIAYVETDATDAAHALLVKLAARDFADFRPDWSRIPLLAMLADVCAVVGEAGIALRLSDILEREATPVVMSPIACFGAKARLLGLLAGVLGKPREAIALFEEALRQNESVGARIETARTQVALIRALLARASSGDGARAATLHAAAAATARELGLGRIGADLERLQPSVVTASSVAAASQRERASETAFLRREGMDWRIGYGDESIALKDTKGMRYLRLLLAQPGQPLTAIELAAADLDPREGNGAGSPIAAIADDLEASFSSRAAVADAAGDVTRAERRGRAADSGEDPAAAAAAERARVNVTRALLIVIRRIAAECPRLGSHLRRSVRTGSLCSYAPDPALGVRWQL